MAKSRQLVVRIDDDLAQVVEETASGFNRSRADVVCAALDAFAKASVDERRKILIAYVTRDIPGTPGTAAKGKTGPKGFRGRAP